MVPRKATKTKAAAKKVKANVRRRGPACTRYSGLLSACSYNKESTKIYKKNKEDKVCARLFTLPTYSWCARLGSYAHETAFRRRVQ